MQHVIQSKFSLNLFLKSGSNWAKIGGIAMRMQPKAGIYEINLAPAAVLLNKKRWN